MVQPPYGDLKKAKLAGKKAAEIINQVSGMTFQQRQRSWDEML